MARVGKAACGVRPTPTTDGNLVFDGLQIFYYDYLDRLCEIYRLIDVGGGANTTTSSSSTQLPSTWIYAALGKKQLALVRKHLELQGLREKAEKNGIEAEYQRMRKIVQSSPSLKGSTTASLTWYPVGLYGYDTFSRRVLRQALIENPSQPGSYLGVSRLLSYDAWQCQEEWAANAEQEYEIFKVHFDGIGIDEHLGFAIATHVGKQVNWTKLTLVQDAQGNVMELLDKDGNPIERYRYDVYGNRTVWSWDGSAWVQNSVGPNPLFDQQYGYTGRRHDPESLLMYYRLRYFYPLQGRFLTQDPIGNWGDSANLGNGYAYVGNQGALGVDPWGLETWVVLVKDHPKFNDWYDNLVNAIKLDPEGGGIVVVDAKSGGIVKPGKDSPKRARGTTSVKPDSKQQDKNRKKQHGKNRAKRRLWCVVQKRFDKRRRKLLIAVFPGHGYYGPADGNDIAVDSEGPNFGWNHGDTPEEREARSDAVVGGVKEAIKRSQVAKTKKSMTIAFNTCSLGLKNPNRKQNAATHTADELGVKVIAYKGG